MKLIKIYNSRSHTSTDLFHERYSSNVFPGSYAFGNFDKLNHFNHYQLWLPSVSILISPSVIPFFMSGTTGLAFWDIWLKGKFSDYTFGLGLVDYLCVSQLLSCIVKLFLSPPRVNNDYPRHSYFYSTISPGVWLKMQSQWSNCNINLYVVGRM